VRGGNKEVQGPCEEQGNKGNCLGARWRDDVVVDLNCLVSFLRHKRPPSLRGRAGGSGDITDGPFLPTRLL
jgi:hypothetical protein